MSTEVPQENCELVEKARDLLVEYMDRHHERGCTNPDCDEVPAILAFIGHSLGIDQRGMQKLPGLLLKEELECPNCNHKHEESN